MALSLGATTPTALYLGTTAISAAYLGATQVYSTGGGDAYAIGGASPELVAAFTTASDGTTAGEYYRKASSETTFSGLFTHSTSGLQTMFDSSGTLVWAPHNYVPYSNDFTLGWSPVFATITTDAISAFGLSGIKLVSASGQTRNEINDVLPTSSVPRRLRVVAKAAEWSWISIHHDGPNSAVWYDIGTGAVGVQQSGGVGEITPLGDGWYACDFISPNWTNGRNVFIRATNANAVGSTGDGTSGIYILCVNQWDDRLPMAENPDAPDAALPWYVETTGAAKYLPRRQAYRYNSGWELAGMQMEAAAATQLLHGTDSFATQTETVTAQAYTLQFRGTGSITLFGAHLATLNGTGANDLVSLTFTPSAGTLTLTPSGTVNYPQLETGSTPSSYIPNTAASGTVTRAAETLSIAGADTPANTTAMSISMKGLMTYADTNANPAWYFYDWSPSTNDRAQVVFYTSGGTGGVYQIQREGGNALSQLTGGGSDYSPGINVAFNIGARHTNSVHNFALQGTAETEKAVSGLSDLSAVDFDIGTMAFNGYISEFRMWGADIGDSGIAEVTS